MAVVHISETVSRQARAFDNFQDHGGAATPRGVSGHTFRTTGLTEIKRHPSWTMQSSAVLLIRTLVATIAFLLVTPTWMPALAQGNAPTDMPTEKFDALVNAITKAVLEKLKGEAAPVAKPAPTKRGPFDGTDSDEPDQLDLFLQQAATALKAVPDLGKYLGDFRRALDDSAEGGLGRRVFLLFLVLVATAAVAAEGLLRAALVGVRHRLALQAVPERGLRSLAYLALLALLDAAAVFAAWLVCRASVALWFSGTTIPDRFAAVILLAIVYWRVYSLVFRVVFQPGLPNARLCDMRDVDARRAYRLVSGFVLLAILLRIAYYVLAAMQATPEAIAAGRVLVAPLLLLVLLWIVVRTRDGARQWLGGLGRVSPVVGFIGRHWVAVVAPFFVAIILTQLYGAISGRPNVPAAMILTLNLAVGLLVFETLLQAVVRRLDSQLPGFTPASDRQKLPDVVARCVRVAVLIGIVVVLAESWVVDVLRLVDASQWNRLTSAGRMAGLTLFIAFVLWELFQYATDAYMARLSQKNAAAATGDGAVTGPTTGSIATRFDTLMPMLRVTVAAIIAVIASLIALEELGVNIGPLLAGASVLGLAISFGSQTLVRDIVSGIFYLGDDAFRVGEYIDCGRAKGTVEGFTLRSIRLRHQNGQIHTIPFGSLGQITNFSRDWTAVKFTLPFARSTDLEKLRKAAKQIGAEMAEEPEFKDQLLEPFKMQGIADVTKDALLVNFKFTARPGNPNAIQNQAVTRLLRALPELGIELS